MRRILTTAALVLFPLTAPVGPALAETYAERLALAEEYAEYTMSTIDMTAIIHTMWQPLLFQAESSGKTVTDAQKAEVDALYQEIVTELILDVTRFQAQIMADHFTYDEIAALNAFMRTEHGAAIMGKMPQFNAALQSQIMAMALKTNDKIMPKIRRILDIQ